MDRIKQALVKARQEGNVGLQAVGGQTHTEMSVAVLKYEYVNTRTTELDPYLMSRNRIVAFNKNDCHSGTFDLLRTKILRKMDENGWRTLAITSPTSGAGKTVVAINLAMSIAQRTERTTLLVDFDLRSPKVANYLGLTDGKSLNDVFQGESEIFEALVNPGLPRLVILPTYKPETSPAELLSSNRTKAMINAIKGRYTDRMVIFDLPSLLQTDDAMAVLPQIDCVLLIIGDGEASRSDIENSLSDMPALNIVGVVLNKSEAVKHGHQ
ncbi:CpsD/CapB family tyrosine-protein kinase [Marinobacter salicampi]|uniref:CpsD/CapB family tyrosine-protein kinase n=1 Tax=Marinobacter salicampi TaxID=435907 RepID=UPI001A93E3B6|nr:CpsD/CapB family tyrosine-protein kinase [Marinobacter salicampi]